MQIPERIYLDIIASMPLSCVDLVVSNPCGEILLLKRQNTPARDCWWFPGGRILYRELRRDAVKRKLLQECGLTPTDIKELETRELQLERDDSITAHSITTIYQVSVDNPDTLKLDFQSKSARWQSINLWMELDLHPFIRSCLERYRKD